MRPMGAERAAAIAAGAIYYDTGKPCKFGHLSKRKVTNGQCYACALIKVKARNKTPEGRAQLRARIKRYFATPKGRAVRNRVARENRGRQPITVMLRKARERAKAQGLPFNLAPLDIVIPKICPVLGIPLMVGVNAGRVLWGSISLDRLKPHLGYVRGNVAVISHRANAIKRDATLDEIRRLLMWMERQ